MAKVDLGGGMKINYCIDDLTDPWRDPETVQTVLMHHGFARNLKFWTPWVATVARRYRVLRYDAPGFGESTAPEGHVFSPYDTPAMLVEAALKLIDKLGIKQVHWFGFMSGGVMGQLFAMKHPERIRSLTLCNSPHTVKDEYVKALNPGYSSMREAITKLGVGGWRRQAVGVSLDMTKADPRIAEWTIVEMGKTRTEVAAATDGFHGPDLLEDLHKIKCPTLLMNGDRSLCMPLEMMLAMQRRILNARMVVFPGIAGSVDMIIPDRCAQVALDFITEVDATA